MRYFRAAIDKYILDRWVSYLVVERRHTHIVEVRGQHLSNEKLQLGLGKKRVHQFKTHLIVWKHCSDDNKIFCVSPNHYQIEVCMLTALVVGQHPPGH